MKKDDTLYLEMMLDHLDAIKAYTPAEESDILDDIQKRDAILLRLQAVGEVMNHISQDFRDQHPDWPWVEAVALRHTISHDYFAISTLFACDEELLLCILELYQNSKLDFVDCLVASHITLGRAKNVLTQDRALLNTLP